MFPSPFSPLTPTVMKKRQPTDDENLVDSLGKLQVKDQADSQAPPAAPKVPLFLILDLETAWSKGEKNNNNRSHHRIFDIAVLSMDETFAFQNLVPVDRSLEGIPGRIRKIFSSIDEMTFAEVWGRLLERIQYEYPERGPVVLMAHYGNRHDYLIIRNELQRARLPLPEDWFLVDTKPLLKKAFPEISLLEGEDNIYSRGNVYRWFLGGKQPADHTAMGDCRGLLKLVAAYLGAHHLSYLTLFPHLRKLGIMKTFRSLPVYEDPHPSQQDPPAGKSPPKKVTMESLSDGVVPLAAVVASVSTAKAPKQVTGKSAPQKVTVNSLSGGIIPQVALTNGTFSTISGIISLEDPEAHSKSCLCRYCQRERERSYGAGPAVSSAPLPKPVPHPDESLVQTTPLRPTTRATKCAKCGAAGMWMLNRTQQTWSSGCSKKCFLNK